MGWDWGGVMAFPLVSSLFWGVEYDRPSLNPFCFQRKFFAACLVMTSSVCLLYVHVQAPLFEWTTPILKFTCLRKNKHDAHPVMFRTFIPNASRSSACISSTYSFPLSRKYLSSVHNPANSTAETVITQRLLEFIIRIHFIRCSWTSSR